MTDSFVQTESVAGTIDMVDASMTEPKSNVYKERNISITEEEEPISIALCEADRYDNECLEEEEEEVCVIISM